MQMQQERIEDAYYKVSGRKEISYITETDEGQYASIGSELPINDA